MNDEGLLAHLRTSGARLIEDLAASTGLTVIDLEARLEDLKAADEVRKSPAGRWFVPGHARGAVVEVKPGFDDQLESIRRFADYMRLCALEEEGSPALLRSLEMGESWIGWPSSREWSRDGGDIVRVDSSTARRFVESAASPNARLLYGYPLYVVHCISEQGATWHAIPLLVQAVDVVETSSSGVRIALADDYPRVNPQFLAEVFDWPEERRDFVEALGLLGSDVEAGVSVHECADRLLELGLPYPMEYVDELAPELAPIREHPVPVEGVHNAAVLATAGELKYRKSLVDELDRIANTGKTADLGRTALSTLVGQGLTGEPIENIDVTDDLPLDEWQLGVVEAAMTRPLTVVTGPPGTGKSQVVAAILAHSALQGKSVLFASYNHKAVSVVEDKLNGLFGDRLLLRCGASRGEREHRLEIADTLESMIAGVLPDKDAPIGTLARALIDARSDLMRNATNRDRSQLEELASAARAIAEDGSGYADWFRAFAGAKQMVGLWCVTNLSAKWSFPLDPGLFDLLVVDEASQCDVASALPLFYRARRAVIIGDPRQLRHITSVPGSRSVQLASSAGARAECGPCDYSKHSLYDYTAGVVGPERVLNLDAHYRSHPEIIGFPNQQWYEGAIQVMTDVSALVDTGVVGHGMYWWPVRSTVTPGSTGVTVDDEARIIVDRLAVLLLEEAFEGTVGVVTPFKAQRDLIEGMLFDAVPAEVLEARSVVVRTAHGFQGDERDIMFFSPCLRPDITRGSFRFLRDTEHLVNVAMTRARAALIIVGDLDACRGCRIPHFEELARYWDELRASKAATDSHMQGEAELFERLVQLRRGIAKEQGVPGYVVFPDETLRFLAATRPKTLDEMRMIKGVGPVKLQKYGELFLEELARFENG